jgi:hypothetical protein
VPSVGGRFVCRAIDEEDKKPADSGHEAIGLAVIGEAAPVGV